MFNNRNEKTERKMIKTINMNRSKSLEKPKFSSFFFTHRWKKTTLLQSTSLNFHSSIRYKIGKCISMEIRLSTGRYFRHTNTTTRIRLKSMVVPPKLQPNAILVRSLTAEMRCQNVHLQWSDVNWAEIRNLSAEFCKENERERRHNLIF